MTSALIRRREGQGCVSRVTTMWRHSKNTAIYKPRRETSEENDPAYILILGRQPPEL